MFELLLNGIFFMRADGADIGIGTGIARTGRWLRTLNEALETFYNADMRKADKKYTQYNIPAAMPQC